MRTAPSAHARVVAVGWPRNDASCCGAARSEMHDDSSKAIRMERFNKRKGLDTAQGHIRVTLMRNKPSGKLRVILHSGSRLKSMDNDYMSDPYAELMLVRPSEDGGYTPLPGEGA